MISTHGLRSLLAISGVAVLGCSTEGPSVNVNVDEVRSQKVREASPNVPEVDRQALASDNAAFATALYKQVGGNTNLNLVFSPASISTALAMTFAGARGETEAQMARALRWSLPQERLHPAMNQVTLALDTRGAGTQGADGKPFRLRIVNSTWAQKDFIMVPAFLDVLAQSYGAGVNLLDFIGATEASRQTINRWVFEQTEERIKDLIPRGAIDPNTRLVLTNAVYFNAAWKNPFGKNTSDGAFTIPDGSGVIVQMMHKEERLRAAVLSGRTAVVLPYQDERLSMMIVLPDPGRLAEVETQVQTRGLAEVDAALAETPVILSMPRFRFETAIDLKAALSALGMPIAFTDGADLSGISAAGQLFIQAVLHKAFIAVAEKGTEAAAATAVVAGVTSAPAGLRVLVDRPFLFFLRDEPTGAILFMGRVSNPSRSI